MQDVLFLDYKKGFVPELQTFLIARWKKLQILVKQKRILESLKLACRLSTAHTFLATFKKPDNAREKLRYIDKAEIFYNISAPEIFQDSLKGILMLQLTYNLKIDELLNGKVTSQDSCVHLKCRQDKLTVQDLTALGVKAFAYDWYDTSILFLLEAKRLLVTNEFANKVHLFALQKLLILVSSYHNEVLQTFASPIGTKWMSFQHPIHIGRI